MMIRLSSHFLTLFALLNVFCSRTSGFAALGTYSHLGLRNAVGFDGQSSEDQSQSPVRADSDIYQNPSSDSDKVYYQLSASMPRTQDEQNASKRHVDAEFHNTYMNAMLKKALDDFIKMLVNGEISSQQDPNSADTLDNPSPVENYVSDAI